MLGTAAYGERFACAVARPPSTASSSTPRSRAPPACACSRTSPRICAADAGVILYPAIDIRDGQAVRLTQGDYERETAYDDDPVDAAQRWQTGGRPLAPRGRPRRRPRRASRATSTRSAASSPRSTARSSSAAGCATRGRSRRRSRPGPSAWCSAPPRSTTPTSPRPSPRRTGPDRRLGRRPLGQGRPPGLDRGDRARPGRADRGALRARRQPLRLHAGRGRRAHGGPGARRPRRRRRRRPSARGHLLRRHRLPRRPAQLNGLGLNASAA